MTKNIGVYELGNRLKNTIKIGRADNLQARLHDLRRKDSRGQIGDKALYFRVEETNSRKRSKQRERALLRRYKEKHGELPEFNTYIA